MRILKVTQAYHPFHDRGGPAIKVRSIARRLVNLGHTVTVLTADLGFGAREIAAAAACHDPQGWRSRLDGIETLYLSTLCHYRNLTVNPAVVHFCRARLGDFDVVHIYGLYDTLGPAVAWHCRQRGIPYVIEPLGMTRPIDRGFALKRIWKRATGPYLRRASSIVTTSDLERDEVLAEGFAPSQVLLRYNGIDLEEFSDVPQHGTFRRAHGIADDERSILFIARLIPRKGADLLIEALSRLASHNVRLVIAGPEGEAGYVDFLRGKARAAQVEDRVLFLGPLYGADKLAALRDADVFALPSRYENFGNTAAEAIACGTPTLVSDQCGIAPLIDGRAGLVTHYETGAVADGLARMLSDAALYRQLKDGCPRVAEEISWGKLVRDMERCYERASGARLQACSSDGLRNSPVSAAEVLRRTSGAKAHIENAISDKHT
jgi:glycosyltransferase involved in cell wall biosynthesis